MSCRLTLVILVGLFALQYRGTGSVGRLFGPVMVVWFVAIGVLGIINIWSAPEILDAFNPLAAVRFAIGKSVHAVHRSRRRVSGFDRRRGALC